MIRIHLKLDKVTLQNDTLIWEHRHQLCLQTSLMLCSVNNKCVFLIFTLISVLLLAFGIGEILQNIFIGRIDGRLACLSIHRKWERDTFFNNQCALFCLFFMGLGPWAPFHESSKQHTVTFKSFSFIFVFKSYAWVDRHNLQTCGITLPVFHEIGTDMSAEVLTWKNWKSPWPCRLGFEPTGAVFTDQLCSALNTEQNIVSVYLQNACP